MSGRQRTGRHKLGCEAETLETLQKADDEVPGLVQRKFLSQTDARAAVEWRVHERCPRHLVEQRGLEPSLRTEDFGIGTPQVRSFVREKGGHHDLRLGWEVELGRAGDDEWVIA